MKFLSEEAYNKAVAEAVAAATSGLNEQIEVLNKEKENLISQHTTALAAKDEEFEAFKAENNNAEAYNQLSLENDGLKTLNESLKAENAQLKQGAGAASAKVVVETEAGKKPDVVSSDSNSFIDNVKAVNERYK